GEPATFTFLRDRDSKLEKHTADVVLGERPPLQLVEKAEDDPAPTKVKELEPKGNALRLGITLTELTPQLMTEKRLTGLRGLYLKEVDPNGLAAEARGISGQQALDEGDVITRINRVPVATLTDFQRVVNGLKAGDPVVLQVSRSARNRVTTRLVQFTYQ
ncbi:MAG: PDZ domain-containing protein, partial [Acidobacteriota bacterium]|nr:PDZ domain-containing protein [Acidobacteriota bacterium]